MSEPIAIGLKRAAIVLADELDYARAAGRLSIRSAELRKQISALEAQLWISAPPLSSPPNLSSTARSSGVQACSSNAITRDT